MKGGRAMTKDQEEFPASELTEEKHRKPYATPELVVHGAVEKLTEKNRAWSKLRSVCQQ